MSVNKEIGRIGQRRYGGFFHEEFLKELQGKRGIEVYREMSENDDVVGSILFSIEMLIRQCRWSVEPGGCDKKDKEAAEFIESCMHDMQDTWIDTISEIMSFITYGWSFHEIVYKRRNGNSKDPRLKSKYSDGLIGWQKLPIRAQETLYEWEYDNLDNLTGMTQMPPPSYGIFTIPIEKALLFRTKSRKNNPEGKSILRNAYRCFDAETEILTKDGWKCGKDISTDDVFATLNPETGIMEYQQASEIHRYKHAGKMISFKSKFLDILVTDNHRMWVRKDKAEKYSFVEAKDVKKSHSFIRHANWIGEEKEYHTLQEYVSTFAPYGKEQKRVDYEKIDIPMDDWLAFLALFLSEGCTYHKKTGSKVVTITQKDVRRDQIKSVLDRLPWHYYEHKNNNGITHYEFHCAQLFEELKCFGKDPVKYVPDYVKELTPRQIKIFLDWYLFGDGMQVGATAKGYDGTPTVGTISVQMANDIQELALKAGFESQISVDKDRKTSYGKNPFYKISLSKIREHKAKTISEQDYNGDVWCPTTENGIVYVRRNGKPAWVGNCWYFKRRIQEIEGIGVERDLAGYPVIYAPEGYDIWSEDEAATATRVSLEGMVRSVRRDESEGLVLPYGYELKLLSTGGARQFDTNAIINRYDTRIAMTVLADFIFLGHTQTGSFALSSNKTELFSMAVGAFLDIICEEFNRAAIPQLIDLNGEHFNGITDYPKLIHGDIEDEDIAKVAAYIRDMTGIGVLVPDDGLEDYIREIGNLPARTGDTRIEDDTRTRQQQPFEGFNPHVRSRSEQYEDTSSHVEPKENQDVIDSGLEDAKVAAARKRLGRGE